MKAQFKYTFKTGFAVRGAAFAVIFVMDAVFITLGSLNLLPFPAKVTAVSLGGVAISVMLVCNIIGDIAIIRRMFSAPEAYLYALTPAPRRKILLASVIAAAVMDIITMAVVITAEVWMSLILAGGETLHIVRNFISSELPFGLWLSFWLLLAAGYLLIMMLILFCITIKKSVLYKVPASGLLTFLLACGCVYITSLLHLILMPFGTVERYGLLIILNFGYNVLPFYALMTLIEAAALFVITSKLMERKINL